MRFAVADEAAALRDAADALLTARATTALIRSAWGTHRYADIRDVWRGLADVGVTGALVPEAGATVTVNVTSVPLGLYDGLAGVGVLMIVVVPTAVPCKVPDRVRLPIVVAAGR